MPTWRFRCQWPDDNAWVLWALFEVTSGITALRRARACSLNLHAHAGGPWHAFMQLMQQSASETQPCTRLMLLFQTWNWHVNYFELLSSSPQENESPQSCWGTVAHVPRSVRKLVGKTERRATSIRETNDDESDPKLGITFGAGQTKMPVYNGGTTSNLMSPPSTEASSERCWSDRCDTGAWASVAIRCSHNCAYLSLSLCVALWVLSSC